MSSGPLVADRIASDVPKEVIEIGIDVPDRLRSRVVYAFEQLASITRMPIRLFAGAAAAECEIVYGSSDGTNEHQRRLPFDSRCYDRDCRCGPVSVGDLTLWAPHDTHPQRIDLVGGIFRLLHLLDESQVADEQRDRRGVFGVAALPAGRQQTLAEPLVENHAQLFRERMQERNDAPAPLYWPAKKKFAVLLTHDTDAVALGHPEEMAFNLAKAVARRDRVRYQMALDGFRCWGRPSEDPFFGFPGWRDLGLERSIRSCFFLSARGGGVSRDLNDVRSSVVDNRFDWKLLREMAAEGWEFGFHAPIHAKDNLDAFLWGKRFIEEQLQESVCGVRHHYWGLDWRHPHRTYRKHVNAGFRYDMSIAWRDAPGLRAATCLPYRPYDPGRQRALNLYVIPTVVMDGHIIQPNKPVDAIVDEALRAIRAVQKSNGVIALDWHTETWCNRYCYRDYRTVLERLLDVIATSDAWVTTPRQLTQHWHQQSQGLCEVQQ